MKLISPVLVLALCLGSGSVAHESAEGVIKQRMELMERFDEMMDRIYAMLHGELSYDPTAIRRAADELYNGSGAHLTNLFPKGSAAAPSEASDAIWSDFRTFEQYARRLGDWSQELAAQADRKPRGSLPRHWEDAVMGPQMMQSGGMMGSGGPVSAAWHIAATCNACHENFRIED